MQKVAFDVKIEPGLQKVSKHIRLTPGIKTGDNARFDVSARGKHLFRDAFLLPSFS